MSSPIQTYLVLEHKIYYNINQAQIVKKCNSLNEAENFAYNEAIYEIQGTSFENACVCRIEAGVNQHLNFGNRLLATYCPVRLNDWSSYNREYLCSLVHVSNEYVFSIIYYDDQIINSHFDLRVLRFLLRGYDFEECDYDETVSDYGNNNLIEEASDSNDSTDYSDDEILIDYSNDSTVIGTNSNDVTFVDFGDDADDEISNND